MKITIDVDCTPEEARRFLGLPDVGGLNEAMVERLKSRLAEGLEAMDPEAMARAFMPAAAPAFEEMMKSFWSMAAGGRKEKE